MPSPIFGEFMGTMVMILLGDGVVADVLLKHSKAEGGGWLAITTGWAFAVMAGIFTAVACGSPDAHLNPAITLAFAIQSGNSAFRSAESSSAEQLCYSSSAQVLRRNSQF